MNSSPQEPSPLEDALNKAISPPLFGTDAASDCPPLDDSPQPPPVQHLGSFTIPCGSWSLLQLDPPNSLIVHVAGLQLRVVAAGKWTPDEPERYILRTPEPPQPQPRESHLSYAERFLQWSQHTQTNLDWMRWNARKAWHGQTVEQLRDLIEADQSVDNPTFLINPNQKNT
jgi:hypothetical protein